MGFDKWSLFFTPLCHVFYDSMSGAKDFIFFSHACSSVQVGGKDNYMLLFPQVLLCENIVKLVQRKFLAVFCRSTLAAS